MTKKEIVNKLDKLNVEYDKRLDQIINSDLDYGQIESRKEDLFFWYSGKIKEICNLASSQLNDSEKEDFFERYVEFMN